MWWRSRASGGTFKSISDFARRVDPKLVNKRAFENLVRAGAFDSLNKNRRQLVENSDRILGGAQAAARERESGQVSLFGGGDAEAEELRLTAVADWPAHERLSEEFSAMGFYLSGHPLDAYGAALKRLGVTTYASLLEDRRAGFKAKLAGTMIKKSERRGRNDQMYAFVSFSDPTGMFEVMLFPEVLAASRALAGGGQEPGRHRQRRLGRRRVETARRLHRRSRSGRRQRGRGHGGAAGIHRAACRHRGPTEAARQGPGQLRRARRRGRGSRDRALQAPCRDGVLRSTIAAIPGVVSVEAV